MYNLYCFFSSGLWWLGWCGFEHCQASRPAASLQRLWTSHCTRSDAGVEISERRESKLGDRICQVTRGVQTASGGNRRVEIWEPYIEWNSWKIGKVDCDNSQIGRQVSWIEVDFSFELNFGFSTKVSFVFLVASLWVPLQKSKVK